MANAKKKAADKLREISEYPICMSAFTDPRILPCIHTFCLNCLTRTGKTSQKKPGDKIPCPLCRKEFTVPLSEGMAGVQKNFFMENFLEFKSNLKTGSSHISCDMCEIRSQGKIEGVSLATMRCLKCKENYCERCAKVHEKQKMSTNHRIVNIVKETKEEVRRVISVTTCTKHTRKPLDYYCGDCKKIVCVSCFVENHKLHDCKDVATVDEEFRQRIENKSWKVLTFADEMFSMRKNTEERKTDFLKEMVERENAIKKRNQELKRMIDQHTKSLLEELSEIKFKHLKEIEMQLEEIDRCWTILRSFESYCTELISKGSASDICRSVDELTARAEELEKDHEAFIIRPRRSVEVSFHAIELKELQKSKRNFVGQINVKTETTAQLENIAIVVGLCDGTTITKDVVGINLHHPNKVSQLQQIPIPMSIEATAASYRNTMYVTGIGTKSDEIWKYNAVSGWTKCASFVQGRRRHSAEFIDEVLYICGGFVDSNKSVQDSVEAYNAVTDKCTRVGKLVHCVQMAGNCVPFRSSLYIFGGGDKDHKALNDVQVYDTKLNTCTLLSEPMPRGYSFTRAALWEASAIFVGCYTCYVFNFEAETWQERNQFKTDVVHFGLVLENERIFVIGGGMDEKDKDGKVNWRCRDDIRYVPIRNLIEDEPIEWTFHAKLPQPSLVSAYRKLTSSVP